MVNLKENIFIEGFEKLMYLNCTNDMGIKMDNVIYKGKTSEIPEETASKCVESYFYQWPFYSSAYKNYDGGKPWDSPIMSIYSACPEPYCIIFKK